MADNAQQQGAAFAGPQQGNAPAAPMALDATQGEVAVAESGVQPGVARAAMEAEAEASSPHAFQCKLVGWIYEMREQYGLATSAARDAQAGV